MPKAYRTSITTHEDGRIFVYGYDLLKLAGERTFSAAIYLILHGQLPDKNSEKMLDALLTVSIDHGVEPPSVVAARNVYSGGSPVQAAVAAGVLTFGEFHGGAIEACMDTLKKYQSLGVKQLTGDFAKSGERISGFGHRLYSVDPRTLRLVEIEKELGKGAKKLPLNIDGIWAALLLEMGFNPKVGKGFFIISRTPGLVAHVVEEALREKPFRRLTDADIEYDGPRPRK